MARLNLISILSGRFLSNDSVTSRIPAIIYIVVLTILYIFNTFDCQMRYRRILDIENQISRLKITATTTQTNRIIMTKESYIIEEIARRNIPLFETSIPPKSIKVNK